MMTTRATSGEEPETRNRERGGGHSHRERVRVRPVRSHGRDEVVTFDNQGEEFHVMVCAELDEGFELEEAVKAEGEKGRRRRSPRPKRRPASPRPSSSRRDVGPGPYVMLCPIQDEDGAHYELGQLVEFEVE